MSDLVRDILSKGGATWHPDPSVNIPKTGYMVSLPYYERKIPVAQFTQQEIDRYVSLHKYLIDSSTYFGAWRENGHIYLDISIHYPEEDLEEALHFAERSNQLAIWSLHNECEIYVHE